MGKACRGPCPGRFLQTTVSATVDALLEANRCLRVRATHPDRGLAGQGGRMLIKAPDSSSTAHSAVHGQAKSRRRQPLPPPSQLGTRSPEILIRTPQARVLVVPGVNPGWLAKNSEEPPSGRRQWVAYGGWVIRPDGKARSPDFPSDTPYRFRTPGRIVAAADASATSCGSRRGRAITHRNPANRGHPAACRRRPLAGQHRYRRAGAAPWSSGVGFSPTHLLQDRPQLLGPIDRHCGILQPHRRGCSSVPLPVALGRWVHRALGLVQLPALIAVGVLGASVVALARRQNNTDDRQNK